MMASIGHNGAPVATIGELRWAIWNSDEPLHVKALALCIVEHMGRGRPWSNPSKARLARLCSVSIKTVERYIQRIERFLCVERRTGATNTYHARIASVAAELDEMIPTDSQSVGKTDEPTPSESPPHRRGVTQTGGHTVPNPPTHSPEPTDSQGVQTFIEPYTNLKKDPPCSPPKGKSQKRAHRMPEDWQPKDQTVQWARNGKIGATDEQVREQLEHFRDHAEANGKRFVDWDKAFQTWMRNAKQWGKISPPRAGPSSNDWRDEARARQERAWAALDDMKGTSNE